ncbi:hypothetical protein ACWEF9_33520 [Streptomyces sp. NPDC004980]
MSCTTHLTGYLTDFEMRQEIHEGVAHRVRGDLRVDEDRLAELRGGEELCGT